MGDSKLYSAQDIEKLKKQIIAHKDTLTKLKTGDLVDNYLMMKNEFHRFKTQVLYLERIIKIRKGKQFMQLEDYKQQVTNLSKQIDSLNQTVEELNHDLSLVTNVLNSDESKDLLKDLNSSIDFQDISNSPTKDEVSEVSLIEETKKSEDITSIPSTRNSTFPSTFKQLQRLSKEQVSIQNETTDLSTREDIAIQNILLEDQQQFTNRNFPSKCILPSQTYNGNYKRVNMRSTISLNHFANKHTVSINTNKKNSKPFTLTHSVPEKNEPETEYFDTEHTLSQIEEKEDIVAISNETIQLESNPSPLTHSGPEKNEPETEYFDTEHTSTQIEEKEDLIAISDETIQPESNPSSPPHSVLEKNDTVTEHVYTEHTLPEIEEKEELTAISNETIQQESSKNNEGFSFWKFFRRKN